MHVLQLNMQKRREVQHSVMNDERLRGYAALVVSEPYVFEMEGKVGTSPMGHHCWTAILPSERHSGPWAVRSMLWVRKDIEYEQVSMLSKYETFPISGLPGILNPQIFIPKLETT